MAGLFGYTHVRHLSFPAIVSLVNFILPAEKVPIASEPSPIEQLTIRACHAQNSRCVTHCI